MFMFLGFVVFCFVGDVAQRTFVANTDGRGSAGKYRVVHLCLIFNGLCGIAKITTEIFALPTVNQF